MNIPELSTTLANMNLQNQVGVAVLSKALDSTEQSGTSLINMMDRSMELSVNPPGISQIQRPPPVPQKALPQLLLLPYPLYQVPQNLHVQLSSNHR